MVVVDASCAVKWFVPEEGWQAARHLLLQDTSLVAPDIPMLEATTVLLSKRRRGEVEASLPGRALGVLDAIRLEAVPHAPLLRDAVALLLRARHAVCDCVYLMVAEQRRLPLATFDRRLALLAKRLAIPLWLPETSQEPPQEAP